MTQLSRNDELLRQEVRRRWEPMMAPGRGSGLPADLKTPVRKPNDRPKFSPRSFVLTCLIAVMAATFAGPLASPAYGRTSEGFVPTQLQQQAANPSSPIQVDYGSTEIEAAVKQYRLKYLLADGRNVAVFRYMENGEMKTITAASMTDFGKNPPREAIFLIVDAKGEEVPIPVGREQSINAGGRTVKGSHAEELIDEMLKKLGIATEHVDLIHSELEPCQSRCSALVARYQNAKVTFNFLYSENREQRRDSINKLIEAAANLYRANAEFEVPDGRRPDEAAGAPLGAGQVPPGGIDFGSLELRYLADIGPGQGANFALQAKVSPDGKISGSGAQMKQQASDAFFVWLALPPDTFTVNLNPTKPEDILDAQFARTDAGRILLEADLRLKKTTAALIHPETEGGRAFWDALQFASGTRRCSSFRTWVHPGTATVRATANELYILNAPLTVSSEASYLPPAAAAAHDQTACPKQEEGIERHNEEVLRTTILPKISEAVNQGPEYQDLRRVYLSRVAAEWVRDRNAQQKTAYSDIIDSGDIGRWTARQLWNPQEVYGRYVKSYSEKEFRVTEKTVRKDSVETRIRSFGGVDFTTIPRMDVGDVAFQTRWPGLSTTVGRSLQEVARDVDGQHLWLGGGSKAPLDDQAAAAPGAVPATDPKATSSPKGRRTGLIIAELLIVTMIVGGWSLVIVRSVRSPSSERRGS